MSTRPKLPKSVVKHFQRRRIVEATIAAVATKGYKATIVADIVAGAGIARNTFYTNFASKEAAFAEAFEAIVGEILEAIEADVNEPEASAVDRAKLGVYAVTEYVRQHRDRVLVILLEAPGALPDQYEATILATARQLPLEEPIAQMLVGGMASILYGRLASEELAPVVDADLVEALLNFVVPHFERLEVAV